MSLLNDINKIGSGNLMEIKGKNIMVTGGAGFIGSHLVDRLIKEEPNKIVVIDNLFLGKLKNLEDAKAKFKNLKIYIRDASIYPVLKEIITTEKINTIFDLATIPLPTSYIQPRWTYENNIRIVLNLCELLRQDKFDFYIHCSSSEAPGTAQFIPMTEEHPLNPTTTYGASKASQDILIQTFDRMYDFNYFIFRPFNNFGERQNDKAYAGVIPLTIKRILNREIPIQHGDGKQTRDFIYVKDTVDGVVRLANSLKSKKQIINVTRGKEIAIKDLIKIICDQMNYKGEIKIIPNPRRTDVQRHYASNQKIKSIIDFNPTDLEKAIVNVIEWYRRNIQ
jgi:UDP-glucose 4-epimerase